MKSVKNHNLDFHGEKSSFILIALKFPSFIKTFHFNINSKYALMCKNTDFPLEIKILNCYYYYYYSLNFRQVLQWIPFYKIF